MKNYILLKANSKTGQYGISKNVFENICQHVHKRVKEALKITATPEETQEKFTLTMKDNSLYIRFTTNPVAHVENEVYEKTLVDVLTSNLKSLCEGVDFKIKVVFNVVK